MRSDRPPHVKRVHNRSAGPPPLVTYETCAHGARILHSKALIASWLLRMQPSRILVRTPARLHFGLFSFGNAGRQFGGVGVMVQQPLVELELRASPHFVVDGPNEDCVRRGVRRWVKNMSVDEMPACHIAVRTAPRRHVGLGSGTQLALCVAAGLHAWNQLAPPTAEQLVRLTGRGGRSAIGTYGFLQGGLIVETGKLPSDEIAPLQQRLAFPESWRFVLVRVSDAAGLHGNLEHAAFDTLPPVKQETRTALRQEVDRKMLPAIAQTDFRAFSESVYRFGYAAGTCFAPVQGGPYNGALVAAMVREIRSLGVAGVGQSSWGPTLFCVMPNQESAETLAAELRNRHRSEDLDVGITSADNQGVRIAID